MSPTPVYYEATAREELAWRIAQAIKDAERGLSAGHLETKEMRNAAKHVLAVELGLEFDQELARYRLVTEWVHVARAESNVETSQEPS